MFEKIKKRYALNNSYFKNRRPQDPSTPFEVFQYYEEHKELPYNMEYDEYFLFNCYVEFNKRSKVFREQFFTPPDTADRMAYLIDEYAKKDDVNVLDLCCGYGQLSKAVKKVGFIVSGIDIDIELCKLYEEFIESEAIVMDFENLISSQDIIIANPPYSIKLLTSFLEKLHEILKDDGIACLLLPKGFFEKERPKKTVDIINKFSVVYSEDMKEQFGSTKINAEILIINKNI